MSKRSSSASELAALDTAPAAAAPDAAAEDGGEVDPMHSKMLSLVLSGVLSACTNGIHDAAAQELPGLFGAPQEGTAHHMNAPAPCIPSARLQGVTSTTAPALQASKQAAKTPSRLTNSSSVPLMERALDAASNVVCNAVGSTGLGAVGVVASAAVRLLRADPKSASHIISGDLNGDSLPIGDVLSVVFDSVCQSTDGDEMCAFDFDKAPFTAASASSFSAKATTQGASMYRADGIMARAGGEK